MSSIAAGVRHDASHVFVEDLADRLLRMYPAQIRACLEELSEEQIWWRPSASTNAVGNLVLHLCGNLRHYLGRGVASTGYRRDRPAEFAAQGPMPRAGLLRHLDEAVADARRAFESLTDARLLETADLGPESQAIASLLVGVTAHFNGHAGQIVYVTKMAREGVFADELWRRVRDR